MKDIQDYLLNKGIKPHLIGFKYLKDAVELTSQNSEYQYSICKMLYPEVARKNKTTASKVERAIRHALFNAKLNYTNAHFIAFATIEIKK